MPSLVALLWACGGLLAGAAAGFGVGLLIVTLAQISDREGAAGYFVVALALAGALLGLATGLLGYARTAPEGERWLRLGQGLLGLGAVVAVLVGSVWAWLQLREGPLLYNGDTQAQLLLELRLPLEQAPPGVPVTKWLALEVTTPETRPEALLLEDEVRREDSYLVIPALQGPLMRSGRRLVVARLTLPGGAHDEVFVPAMPRTPDPRAPWSAWQPAQQVFVDGAEQRGRTPLLQLRWRLRLYGQ